MCTIISSRLVVSGGPDKGCRDPTASLAPRPRRATPKHTFLESGPETLLIKRTVFKQFSLNYDCSKTFRNHVTDINAMNILSGFKLSNFKTELKKASE